MLVGHPFLRMTAFHVFEGVLTIVAILLPVQRLRFGTVPKVYRRARIWRKITKDTQEKYPEFNHNLFIVFSLYGLDLVGPEGFEPPTKGL